MEELRAADERLRAIMNTTPDPMFMKDREGRYLVVNPALLRAFGRSAEEVLGRDDLEIQLDPAVARETMATDRRVMEEDAKGTFEMVLKTTDGPRTFLTTKAPFRDRAGRVIGVIGTARDITQRKKAEEALRKSEGKYRGLFEHMQDLVVVLGYVLDERDEVVDWTIEDANPPTLRYFGAVSLRDLAGRRLSELVEPPDMESYLTIANFVRRDGTPFVHDRHDKESARDFIMNYIPLDRERFILTATDITDIKTAQRRLEDKRARLRAIIDNLPVGIAIADTSGCIVEVNRMIEQIWGAGALGMGAYGDQMVWRAGTERPLTERDQLMARALAGEMVINEEFDIRRADGTVGTVIASAAPIVNSRDKIIGALTTAVDITERRTLEKELAEAKSRAETYLDVLTHDVNNYNTAAMGYLQLAEMRLDLDETQMRYIVRPLEVLGDSSELIANVRDLQRLEAGRNDAGTADVCRMLREIKEAYEDPPGREVAIRLSMPDHCTAMASGLLRNAFSNIVSNAIKHSAGPLEIGIRLDFQKVGGEEGFRVSIEDNGPGIPDERKKVIFDRALMGLTRTVSRGLGLYLVKRLVEDLDGRVWVEDRVPGDHSQGARFVVLLPMRQAGPKEKPNGQEDRTDQGRSSTD